MILIPQLKIMENNNETNRPYLSLGMYYTDDGIFSIAPNKRIIDENDENVIPPNCLDIGIHNLHNIKQLQNLGLSMIYKNILTKIADPVYNIENDQDKEIKMNGHPGQYNCD